MLFCELFVLRRTEVVERRMTALPVVEDLDVIEERLLGVAERGEVIAELELERREPALHRCVVEAVATATHAASYAVRRKCALLLVAGVRRALVGVLQQPSKRTATPHSQHESTKYEPA